MSRRYIKTLALWLALQCFVCQAFWSPARCQENVPVPPLATELRPPITDFKRYTLADTISTALKNYPSIAAVESRSRATATKITLAKTEYLPKLDLFLQELRGSDNNVLGILFPPLSIPQVTGKQEAPISFDSVWASNASSFFSWEIADFGLRKSRVAAARADNDQTIKHLELTKFSVACAAAEAYFSLLAAEQRVRAQKAYVERMKVFALTVKTYVDSDLRPGVDSSRADAELAKAYDKLIAAEQQREVARAIYAEKMGLTDPNIEADPGPLLVAPDRSGPPTLPAFQFHPAALHQASVVKTVQLRTVAIEKEWRPHIYLETALFARGGTGDFRRNVARLGYLPNVPNWAVGFKAQFHVFEYFSTRAKAQDQRHVENEERARYEEIMLVLRSRDAQARALIDGATRLSNNAATFLKAASETELRSKTRYGVGLNTVVDVAEAENLMTDAQVTYDLAGLGVWRSYLAAAEAHGDLAPFLQLVASAAGEKK